MKKILIVITVIKIETQWEIQSLYWQKNKLSDNPECWLIPSLNRLSQWRVDVSVRQPYCRIWASWCQRLGFIYLYGTSPSALTLIPRGTCPQHIALTACWMLQVWIKSYFIFNRWGEQIREEKGPTPGSIASLRRGSTGSPTSQWRHSWAPKEDRHLMSLLSPQKPQVKVFMA